MKNKINFKSENIYIFMISFYLIDTFLRTIIGSIMPKWEYSLFFTLILFLMVVFSEKKIPVFKRYDLILLVLLFLTFISSSLLNSSLIKLFTNEIFFLFIWFFAFYAYCTFVMSNKQTDILRCKVLKIIFVFMAVIATANLFIYLFIGVLGIDVPFESLQRLNFGNGRFQGFIGNENLTGQFALLGVLSAIGLYFEKKLNVSITITSIAINVIVLYLTDSRTSILALLVGLTIIFGNQIIKSISKISKNNKIFVYLLIIIICGFFTYKVIGVGRVSNMSFSSIEMFLNTITSERYNIWKEIVKICSEFPIFGIGIGNLLESAKNILGPSSSIVVFSITNAHNIFLELLYTTGIIGLCIGTLFFINLFKFCFKIDKNNKKNLINISFVVSIFVVSLLDNSIFFGGPFLSPLFWLFSGFIANTYYYGLERYDDKSNFKN